ncbi:MAG: TolC family protein [Bacteroidia bacterium]|nr:TolC family protein [Bacteroidia bacterium]
MEIKAPLYKESASLNARPASAWMKLTALIFLLPLSFVHAQSTLDDYVKEGLKSNLALQEKTIAVQQAQAALQTARSYFLPSVTALVDYTSGDGGRSIALPVGDLLNPVYASLNQLTSSDAFPQIENVEQNFFPKNFYDARVRTTLPIVNTDLYVNRTIKTQQAVLEQQQVDLYKRELVYEIKTAYYQYLSAGAAVAIYESAEVLVRKNHDVNQSLLENGKALPASVLRSKSEIAGIEAELTSARNLETNARQYFNFLLNRPLDTPIEEVTSGDTQLLTTYTDGVDNREELKLLTTGREIQQSVLRLSQLSRLPKVNAFLDLGSQASDWKFNDQSRYYLVGVQFSVPIFQGFRTNISIRQNRLDIARTELRLQNTRKQLMLAASNASNDAVSAARSAAAASDQLRSAQSYFNLVDKGYSAGVYTLIEFLDARNQLTRAQLQVNLRQFEWLRALAQVERENAAYSFQ